MEDFQAFCHQHVFVAISTEKHLLARAERERVVESVFEKSNRPGPTRPDPARPDPTRPAISATRIGALKKPDFGTPVLVSFGAFLSLAPPRPACLCGPGPASPRPARLGFGWFW